MLSVAYLRWQTFTRCSRAQAKEQAVNVVEAEVDVLQRTERLIGTAGRIGQIKDRHVFHFEEGGRYRLYFSDPVRLRQSLEDDTADGRPYYAEPGLIILPEVTREAIQRAVAGLWRDGYFQHLKPLV